jgi:hypothetical protein
LASFRKFPWTPRIDEAFIAMPSKKMMPADSIIAFNGQRQVFSGCRHAFTGESA